MWSDGWVMSNCPQDSQKVCTKLLSLPDNAKKLKFLVPQLKFGPSPKLHPQSDHIINTHTNQVKLHVWICPETTSIPVYKPKHTSHLKNSNFDCAGFEEKFDTPLLKPTKTETSYRKLNCLMCALCKELVGED